MILLDTIIVYASEISKFILTKQIHQPNSHSSKKVTPLHLIECFQRFTKKQVTIYKLFFYLLSQFLSHFLYIQFLHTFLYEINTS